VESVLQSPVPLQIIVGDNGSSDDSVTQLEQMLDDTRSRARCDVHRFGINLGFAKAVNRLIAASSADYLLLLNPDCYLPKKTLPQMLVTLATDSEAGMAGCVIRNPDGSEQRGCRRKLPTLESAFVRAFPKLAKWLGRTEYTHGFDLHLTPLPTQTIPIEAISGAFMLIRGSTLEKVGLMDEGYFLHCEDIDWCARFTQAGFRILFVPSAEIIHKQGACSAARPIRVEWHKHFGMYRFYRKFYGKQNRLMLLMVGAAIVIRLLMVVSRQLIAPAVEDGGRS